MPKFIRLVQGLYMMKLWFIMKNFRFEKFGFVLMQNNLVLS